MDSLGNFVWANTIGSSGYDEAYSLALDNAGNVYTTGYFQGSVDFDPGIGIYNLYVSAGDNNAIYIYKLSTTGNFVWAKSISGPFTNEGRAISIDAAGYLYTSGTYTGSVDMDPGVGIYTLLTTPGNFSDAFVLKQTSAGDFIWAKRANGSNNEMGAAMAVNKDGFCFVAGYFFSSTVSFDSSTIFNADNTSSTYDTFIAKLDTTVISNVGIENISKQELKIIISPNPFSTRTIIEFNEVLTNCSLKIMDVAGKEIKHIIFSGKQLSIEKDNMEQGIYFIQLVQENKIIANKKIIIQ